MNRTLLIAVLISLTACGGRKAAPVETVRVTDAKLTCGHIEAEREVNAARVVDLAGESAHGQKNNLGLFFLSPIFLDLSEVEQKEVRAIGARNDELDRLRAAKGCA